MLKNFYRLFDEHVKYALAHSTSRLLFLDRRVIKGDGVNYMIYAMGRMK